MSMCRRINCPSNGVERTRRTYMIASVDQLRGGVRWGETTD
jgi:hypothetical protein